MRQLLLTLALACVLLPCVAQQDAPAPTTTLPTVTGFDCPKYPPKAEAIRLQGMVRVQVTTDGHVVTGAKAIQSHPLLAEAALKNIHTWIFADHAPTSFTVTYFYVDEGYFKRDKTTKCDAKLELPTKVTVSTKF